MAKRKTKRISTRKKDPCAVELGRKGGMATARKYRALKAAKKAKQASAKRTTAKRTTTRKRTTGGNRKTPQLSLF